MSDILETIIRIISKETRCVESDLTLDSAVGDVPGWDSLGNVRVIAAVEDHFKLTFTVEETLEIESVEDFVDILRDRGIDA